MDTLQQLRKKIDQIDSQIIDLLAQRCSVVEDMKSYKKDLQLSYLDEARWNEVLQSNIVQGKKK